MFLNGYMSIKPEMKDEDMVFTLGVVFLSNVFSVSLGVSAG